MIPLTAKKRSELRAEAHKLGPIVLIGDKGLTDEVLAEIDRSLKAHELIKVRAATDDRAARDAWLETICERLQAHPVQQIGKVFVIFRESPRDDSAKATKAPERKPGKPAAGTRRPRTEVVSERGKLRQKSRDQEKQRQQDVKDMIRKGKIKLDADGGLVAGRRGAVAPPEEKAPPAVDRDPAARGESGAFRGTSRPRSRTPSPRPASGPARRRPRTSR